MSQRCVAWWLLALTTCSLAAAQEKVDRLADRSRIGWKGVTAFAPDTILDAVFTTSAAWPIAHPLADRAPYLDWLRDRITSGYRYAGYRDVEVAVGPDERGDRLSIVVTEGDLIRAAAPVVTMEPRDETIIGAVVDALASPRELQYAHWRAGGPARFGDAALEEIRATIVEACTGAGAVAPEVELKYGDERSGQVALEIVLRHAQTRPIQSLHFEGIDTEEAGLVLDKIGFHPGELASPLALDGLVHRITDIGRYRTVEVVPPAPAGESIDPLVIRLTPTESVPSWQDMPWAEMDLVRRASRDLVDRLAHDATMHWSIPMSGSDEHADVSLSRQTIAIQLPESLLGNQALGSVHLAIDTTRGVQIATTTCGEVLRIPWNLLVEDDGGALFRLSLSPSASADGENQVFFGLGFVSNLPKSLDDTRSETVIRVGPHFAAAIKMHGATLLSILQEHRARGLEKPGELILGSDSHPDAVHIDRATARARIAFTDDDNGRFEIVDAPDPAPTIPIGRGTLPEIVDSDALRLALIAFRALDVPAGGDAEAEDDHPRFRIGGEWSAGDTEAVAVGLGLLLRKIAEQYPDDSWPHIFARDLPWMFMDARQAWPVIAPELDQLARDGTCGPLGFGILALTMAVRGAMPAARWSADVGARSCQFDRAWSDIEALCPPDSPADHVLRAIGARWRAQADSMSPALRDALKSADDDRTATRTGCQTIWESGGGKWLRKTLAEHSTAGR